ncbi:MAG: hypothetical protein H8E66_18900 [Planctomycetes bacterium]|nr:hypothetical protein [Planctomycetota bacterium]
MKDEALEWQCCKTRPFGNRRKWIVGVSRLCLAVVVASCIWGESVSAHPISLSSTVIDVHEDHVHADVQIMLEDLVLYHELESDANYVYSATDLKAAAEKHKQFVLDYFSILDADGRRLVGTLEELETDKVGEKGVRQTDLMKRSVNYVLSFPVDKRQNFFTFTQSFGGPNAVLPALMDLMVMQNGILIERPIQLTLNRPHSTKFNWDHPPTNEPTSFRELRRKRDEQLQKQLGIATYGGLYSFLYVTRFEVRHEILIPLLTLEQWVPLQRKHPDFLEVDEQQAARDGIERFFKDRNPASVNGQKVSAQLTRLNFFGLDINDFALNAEPRRVSVHQARVGVILTYPSRETPATVAMQWSTFSEHAPYLRSIVLVGNEVPKEHNFRVSRPGFEWSGKLIATKVAPVSATARALTDQATSELLEALLRNIYGAFDFRDDSDVYDALATSVEGALLRELYLRVKRSLVMAEQGGALSHVDKVEILSVTPPTAGTTPTTEATWRVAGTVEHWGHVHTRVNEYRGRVSVVLDEGTWKLQALQLLGEKRIKFETRIRGYDRD